MCFTHRQKDGYDSKLYSMPAFAILLRQGFGGRGASTGDRRTMNKTEITTSTKLCAVIGDPVAHSMSPAIHNAAFQELGLDFVYLAFNIRDVKPFLEGMREMDNFRGLSVTIPHKVSVIEYLDEINEVDRQIGSVNTIVNDNGRLIGFGSDGPGASKALIDAGVDVAGQPMMILGSGGAARAISFDLAHNSPPSSLVILGVVEQELNGLVRDLEQKTEIDVRGEILDEHSLEKEIALVKNIIHATPVGMHPNKDDSLIASELLHRDLSIMDIVYNPFETKLIKEAKSKGINAVPGYEMFVNQAAIQFEAWTGNSAPIKVMEKTVREKLGQL